ncbi:MAG: phosphoenolpyruvate synthase regulatory protein [Proteobacteria bacterium]|nr:MAG: phosphoenolpyruvate synthase regulatory protein [Pseudomonadota bacterium]
MKRHQRTAYYLSDRTGITAETLGHSLLTQFDGIEWNKISVPFMDTLEKAQEVAEKINQSAARDGYRPMVFSTVVDPEMRQIIKQANCLIYDFFGTFIGSMEEELQQTSAHVVGRSHGVQNNSSYFNRIAAINYTLNNDDGISAKNFSDADIILIGVSRSGKTPTCLYLALQYGIAAANYPLTEEDMDALRLPKILEPYRAKLFGLTLSAEQLYNIRQGRRRNSQYAALAQCQRELQWQESMYRVERIPYIDTSTISIEEISTTILTRCGLRRLLYGQ